MGQQSRAMKTQEEKTRVVTAAVIERDGKVLVARRKAELIAGGMWEFPGGKLEEGEEPRRGLERARDFSWDDSGRALLAVYEQVCRRPRGQRP